VSGSAARLGRVGRDERGFTLFELLTVLTIAAILTAAAEPVYHTNIRRSKEAALKQDLFVMRDMLDQYRADRGRYPKTLEDIVETGYLRQLPTDPFTHSERSWQIMRQPDDQGIYDVHSGSEFVALDGTPYNGW
jgi:general secretion pathway protein G